MLGESTNKRLMNKYSQEYCTVYLTKCNRKNFVDAVKTLHDVNGSVIFYSDHIDANNNTVAKIFYTGESEATLRKKLELVYLHYDSLVMGDCTYELHPMSEISLYDAYDDAVLFCDSNAVDALRSYLKKYADSVSSESPSKDDRYSLVLGIGWAFIIIMTLAVTAYDIFSQYKTAAVNLVLGNRLRGIVGKNILTDTVGITGSFLGISLILSFVTAVNMNLRTIVQHWLILLALNSLTYLIFYKTDLFRALRDGEPSARLLNFNYVMKVFAVLGVMTASVYCVTLLSELGDDLKVYDEIKKLEGYSYVDVQMNIMPDFDTEEGINHFQYIKEKSNELKSELTGNREKVICSAQEICLNGRETGSWYAVVGRDGFGLLKSGIPNVSDDDYERNLLLIPEKATAEEIKSIREYLDRIGTDEDGSAVISFSEKHYKKGSLFALNNGGVQKIASIDSPIIIYTPNNTAAEQMDMWTDEIVKISNEEFDAFIKEYGDPEIDFDRIDVFSNYLHLKGSAQSFSLILTVSLICAVVFELTLLISILTLEYKVNAKEICVRKVLGATLLDRNKKLFILTLLTDMISVVGAHFILDFFGMENLTVLCVSALILIVTELSVVFIKAKQIEKINTAKILKGGAL